MWERQEKETSKREEAGKQEGEEAQPAERVGSVGHTEEQKKCR